MWATLCPMVGGSPVVDGSLAKYFYCPLKLCYPFPDGRTMSIMQELQKNLLTEIEAIKRSVAHEASVFLNTEAQHNQNLADQNPPTHCLMYMN